MRPDSNDTQLRQRGRLPEPVGKTPGLSRAMWRLRKRFIVEYQRLADDSTSAGILAPSGQADEAA